MASKTSRSVDKAVAKMLKRATRRSSSAGVAEVDSRNNAALALANMAVLQKHGSGSDTDAAARIVSKSVEAARESGARAASAPPSVAVSAAKVSAATSRRLLIMTGAVTVLVACAGILVWRIAASPNYSVAGSVMLDKVPLSNVEVIFYMKGSAAPPVRVLASGHGAFRVRSLPAGEYALVLRSTDDGMKVPQQYQSAEATPFQLRLTKSRADLRMLASSGGGK